MERGRTGEERTRSPAFSCDIGTRSAIEPPLPKQWSKAVEGGTAASPRRHAKEAVAEKQGLLPLPHEAFNERAPRYAVLNCAVKLL